MIDIFGLLTRFNSLVLVKFDRKTELVQVVQAMSEKSELRFIMQEKLVS